MRFTPQMLGAAAVIGMAGAVSGAAIGESPILTRSHSDSLPQSTVVSTANKSLTQRGSPPDHYPLETKHGTIEVAELALHGRLRERGGKMWWEDRETDDRAEMNGEYDFYRTASPERIAHEERLLAFTRGRADLSRIEEDTFVPSRSRVRAEAPMALAEPVELSIQDTGISQGNEQRAGKAKTIDVSVVLALRD